MHDRASSSLVFNTSLLAYFGKSNWFQQVCAVGKLSLHGTSIMVNLFSDKLTLLEPVTNCKNCLCTSSGDSLSTSHSHCLHSFCFFLEAFLIELSLLESSSLFSLKSSSSSSLLPLSSSSSSSSIPEPSRIQSSRSSS